MIENTTKVKSQILPNKSQITNSKGRVNGKEFNLRKRTFHFSKRVLEIVDLLPKNNIGDIFRVQLIKSGTSIGANVEESDGTLTKRDFTNKLVLARKEAKETRYWLRLIEDKYIKKEHIINDIQEVQELINILSAIINKTKDKKDFKIRAY